MMQPATNLDNLPPEVILPFALAAWGVYLGVRLHERRKARKAPPSE